jgi:hypothetical protein
MNNKMVVNGKRTSENSPKLVDNQSELLEEEIKLNASMVSPIKGKRFRRRPVKMCDDFLW